MEVLELIFATTLNNELLNYVFTYLSLMWPAHRVVKIILLSGRCSEENMLFDLMLEAMYITPGVRLTFEHDGEIIDKKAVWEWLNALCPAEKDCTPLHFSYFKSRGEWLNALRCDSSVRQSFL
jgi:hypothetical protein